MKNAIFNQKLLNQKYNEEVDLDNPKYKNQYDYRKDKIRTWVKLIQDKTIDTLNETQIKSDFITDILGVALGYKSATNSNNKNEWTMLPEAKTNVDGTKADVVLGFFTKDKKDIRVAIELKGPTANLDAKQTRKNDNRTPVEQGFDYLPKYGKKCKWLIVSNYKEIRLYSATDASEYEVFYMESLLDTDDEFKRFLYLLSSKSLINKDNKSRIELLWEENINEKKKIEKDFYQLYKKTRLKLFNDILENNKELEQKLVLKKTQKLLDRFIFVCFAKDKNLVPAEILKVVIDIGKRSLAPNGIWREMKGLFQSIDEGNEEQGINQFNGGLFSEDKILDDLRIPNKCFEYITELSTYDFSSDLNENILGHVFEQSLSDLEEIRAEIDGIKFDEKKGKRKINGIFYTPKYITKYIVETTIGDYFEKKRMELGEDKLPELKEEDFKVKINKTGKFKKNYTSNMQIHIDFYTKYRNIVANVKVLDPACGSGAFLNEAFDYLKKIGQELNNKLGELTGEYTFFDLNEEILKNNLYGVDLNEESVEITRLSLWLKTANKYTPLTSLDNNIKVGNSLVENLDENKETNFDWNKEFEDIMLTGGFDIIIGNPPYVGSKEIEEKYRKYYWSKYEDILIQDMDLYELFIYDFTKYKLKKDGLLGFITPNTYYTAKTFSKLRRYLFNDITVKTIIDFPYRFFPFEEVNKETAILILEKKKQEDYIIELKTIEKDRLKELNYFNQSVYRKETCISKIDLIKNLNYTIVINVDEVILKMLNSEHKIGKYLNVHKGWMRVPKRTVTNKAIYDTGIFTAKDIENDEGLKITRKYIEGRDINRYYIDNIVKYVSIENIDPEVYSWHNEDKIITQRIVGQNKNKITATVDFDKHIVFPNANLINLRHKEDNILFYLGVINSKIINYFYSVFYGESNTNITNDAFENIPIFKMDNVDKEIIAKSALKLMELHKNKDQLVDKFLNSISREFKIKDLKKVTMHKFYEWNYDEFLKKIKKVKLTLIQKDEIEEYFNQYKVKLTKEIEDINKLEENINKLVYNLYGLNEAEIDIVEKG